MRFHCVEYGKRVRDSNKVFWNATLVHLPCHFASAEPTLCLYMYVNNDQSDAQIPLNI